MLIQIKDSKVFVAFPLTQGKASWNIRPASGTKVKSKRIFRHKIEAKDSLECMVNYEELRDMISAFRCINPANFEGIQRRFEEVRPKVSRGEDAAKGREKGEVTDSRSVGDIGIEVSIGVKARKRDELYPNVFMLFDLSKNAPNYWVEDKRDQKIDEPVGRRIRSGDKLVWNPDLDEVVEVLLTFARLSEDHKKGARKAVFEAIAPREKEANK